MDDCPFRSRAQGAVDSERMQLLSIIAYHWKELESYEYGGGTQKQKWDLWDDIGKEFNSHPSVTVTRTPLQIKTLFKNMKTKAKKYKSKLESCKANGVILESDIVSETVLKLTKTQSKESLQSLLESLKNIKYFDPKTNMPLSLEDGIEIENSRESSNSLQNWQMGGTDSDDMPDIKEEVIEAFDSPCIIREDQSPILFPLNDDSSDDNDSVSDHNMQPVPETSSSSSEIHTFGDISVTPLSNGKKSPQNLLKLVSPVTLGIKFHQEQQQQQQQEQEQEQEQQQQHQEEEEPSTILSESNSNRSNDILSNRIILQPKSVLNTPLALFSLSNLMEQDLLRRAQAQYNSAYLLNKLSTVASSYVEKSTSEKSCCCPDYHKKMLSLAQKEHELTISLINEKIQAKREERRLHEEERKFREQNFLLKQEERRASLAEHQARMKLIELECEATQKRYKLNNSSNRWILRNGSKEI